MVIWYWSADSLFWQLSINHNMDTQMGNKSSWDTWKMTLSDIEALVQFYLHQCCVGAMGCAV